MTVVISLPHPRMILMAADSAKRTDLTTVDVDFNPVRKRTEYSVMDKVLRLEKIGCVTMWGNVTRIEGSFRSYVRENIGAAATVEDVRVLTERYLTEELIPGENEGDVGFHIGGFMPDRTPRLFHVFWGKNQPAEDGEVPDYHSNDHREWLALYNGRNDWVDPVVRFVARLQLELNVTVISEDPVERVLFADFVTRYVSELGPDVGGMVQTILIIPDNRMVRIQNPLQLRLPKEEMEKIREIIGRRWGWDWMEEANAG